MISPHPTSAKVVRLRDLTALISLSRSTVYGLINPRSSQHDPSFPKPVRLGTSPRSAIGWRVDEVLAWLETRERVRPLD